MRVCIDPGHYKGYNQGITKNYYEGTSMFYLATYLKAELEKYKNMEVILTKTTPEQDLTLDARGNYAKDCDVFISLHSNAVADSSARGVLSFYSVRRPNSKNLCDKIGNAVASVMSSYYRGSQTKLYPDTSNTDYYGVIRSAAKHKRCKYIFLVEHGFHTNWSECSFLSSLNNLKKIAEEEARVIAENFYLPKKEKDVLEDMTEAEFNKALEDFYEKKNPMYKDIKDVPEYWRPTIQKLLDRGIINGGTKSEVNNHDVNMRHDTIQSIIVSMNILVVGDNI